MLNFINLEKNTQFWAYSAHPRLCRKAETLIFWSRHCMNENRLLEFLRNSIYMKIESHQTEPEKRKISTKKWRVPNEYTRLKIFKNSCFRKIHIIQNRKYIQIYMVLSNTRQHFSLRFSFFQAQSDGSQF